LVPDHVGLRVSDLPQSRRFCEEALFPFGYAPVMEHEMTVRVILAKRHKKESQQADSNR
jgi:hypothetical protein